MEEVIRVHAQLARTSLESAYDTQVAPVLRSRRFQQTVQSMGTLTASFYLITAAFQRAAGALTLHSGRPALFSAAVGMLSTTAACVLAREAQERVTGAVRSPLVATVPAPPPSLASWWWPTSSSLSPKPSSTLRRGRADDHVDAVRRALLSVGLFALLEQRSFLTALPSSVISLGVYAQRRNMLLLAPRGSVPATDDVATDKQRRMIQALGRRLGCHHCGSRQLFRGGPGEATHALFIADHQPPTKVAKALSDRGWRKWLRRPVVQHLWPQCLACFHKQGSAVRANTHLLVHHHQLRLCHLAPALAFLLADHPTVQEWLEPVVQPAAKWVEHARRRGEAMVATWAP